MESLEYIKEILKKEGRVKEDSYKQRVFLKFFQNLGYDEDEIRFEDLVKGSIYDTSKFVDVTCGDILIEVKSSDKALNSEVLKQAFGYNQGIGVNIIGASNFKIFQFYDKSVNNLILEFDINNYHEHLHDIYKILGKYTFLTYDQYIQYHERSIKVNKIINELENYLNDYKKYQYRTLPFTDEKNLIILEIKNKLNRLRYNNGLNKDYDFLLNDLFNACLEINDLKSMHYFHYMVEDKIIYQFKELWLKFDSKDKYEFIIKMNSLIDSLEKIITYIKGLDQKISLWNNMIWNLNDYYEEQARFY